MRVNLKYKTGIEKERRPQSNSINIIGNNIFEKSNNNNNFNFDEFKTYVYNLEDLLKDTINDNLKLRLQLNEVKKNPIEPKKLQAKADDLIKKFSKGRIYLNEIEKRINQNNQGLNIFKKRDSVSNELTLDNTNVQNMIAQYESQIESFLQKTNIIENKLNKTEKEKDDLKNKFNDEFVLMSSVIYNLGFLYWSMKSDYEDKLKQNKGWLEMERIKQYNGDY